MSSSPSRIAELAAAVAEHTQRIDKYLAEKGLAYPSFDANGPVDLGLPPDLEQSRITVLQASQELNDLLQGPRDLLFDHQAGSLLPLKLISHFDLANKVPANGEISFTGLAATAGIDQAAITRILRYGITRRIFKEPRPGFIAHSAASRLLADDSRVANYIWAVVDIAWPAAGRLVDALVAWPDASEPNQTGFSLSIGSNQPLYAILAKDPERAHRFAGAMSFFTTGEEYSLRHITDGYPWDTVPSGGTVVDVGGSQGDTAFALARKYPNLHLIVQDLPAVVANAKEDQSLNVKFLGHDFFNEQPVKGADVYYYRWILHNWPDKYCMKILRALIPALKKGARILVMDFVMPPPGVLPNNAERKLRAMDLMMLKMFNAKERDVGEWKTLFEQADTRFVFKGVKQPPGSRLAIVETVWGE